MAKRAEISELMAAEEARISDLMAEEATGKPIRFGNNVVELLEKIGKIPNSAKEVFLWDLLRLAKVDIKRYRLKRLDKHKIKYTREEDSDFVINIEADNDNQTLSITHKGMGLEKDYLMHGFGGNALEKDYKLPGYTSEDLVDTCRDLIDEYLMIGDPNAYYSIEESLGSSFTLGLYSAFMVADRVVITTKEVVSDLERIYVLRNGNFPRKGDQYVLDASASDGSFRIARDDPEAEEDRLKRGTKVTLYLKKEYLTYLDVSILRELVGKCTFDACPYPIYVSSDHQRANKRQNTAGREEDLESLKKDFEALRQLCVQALRGTPVEKVVVDDRAFDLPCHVSNCGRTFYINPRSPIMKSLLVRFHNEPQMKKKNVEQVQA